MGRRGQVGRVGPLLAAAVVSLAAAACDGGGEAPCASSRECSATGEVCDVARGVCVECLTGVDCFGEDEVCRANRCEAVTACTSSRQCPGLVCDERRGYCVECVADVDCFDGRRCDEEGFCQTPPPPCESDRQCSELGLVCDTGRDECVECVRDADCSGGFRCEGNTCRRILMDASVPQPDGSTTTSDGGRGTDGGTDSDGGEGFTDSGSRDGGGPRDSGSDRLDACSSAAGSVLLLLDFSSSMNDPTEKWSGVRAAIRTAIRDAPDAQRVGLYLWPDVDGGGCAVLSSAAVPVGPLSSTRSQIESALQATPSGSGTPIFAALHAGYDLIGAESAAGARAVVLITDGSQFCDVSGRSALLERVERERVDNGITTHVIGIDSPDGDLSRVAVNGGTRRSSTCVPHCSNVGCDSSADCYGGGPCEDPLFPESPGRCGCTSNTHCPPPQVCHSSFGLCGGDPNCCHVEIPQSTVGVELAFELEDILARYAGGGC